MTKLLVNNTEGVQEVIVVGQGGGYFDLSRVLWDERIDGPLPEIQVGGMVRVDGQLVLDPVLLAAHQAAQQAKADALAAADAARAARTARLLADHTNVNSILELKALVKDLIDDRYGL